MKDFFKTWRQDIPSGLVVFLVALPLCLGVGLASTNLDLGLGIPKIPNVFSGILAGIAGGVVVGFLSGSRLGVSGPAAGLITIVISSITVLQSFEAFLVAVVLAGCLQVLAGYLRLGVMGNYFPTAVIKGMLAAIGITLILKEIPHAIGYDKDFFGDESFAQTNGHNSFNDLFYAMKALKPGAVVVSIVSIALLLLFDRPFFKKYKIFKFIPGALIVVVFGIVMNIVFQGLGDPWVLDKTHLVALPVATSFSDFLGFFTFPDFTALGNIEVYKIAATIALVASLETLLSVEATDKLDPKRMQTPTNKELKAQGIGNIFSGLIGGLPVTQVIVRSSANISSGGESKLSTIFHGLLLVLTVILIPRFLNMILLASLACILFMVGYKLARIELFKQMYALGWAQFLPFIGTVVGVLLTDLLSGIGIGMAISIFFILRNNLKYNYTANVDRENLKECKELELMLSEDISFLNKGGISEMIEGMEPNTKITIDGTKTKHIDYDVLEYLSEFVNITAKNKNIQVTVINVNLNIK